ncbi:TauD Probable taurine catabolism dioxygenase [Pyrenophora tritici-repentis]|uniref:Alpha-ketoglutarate-dependent taurine dioxygenase protein n=2 Tax=Pyrenophora tritici-repentis TaxID=45151 RepID=A0A2W1E923_9PLEO|nr:alpha-ketoglutarate-dependent taurine dioxygenase [Pyrenophora tritici-repentis Pt-1C-BFP]KAA8627538.1 alpha-ketoglutarate-dependent taurine dioxygenase protein [Pyrenophora tritici-repentis]EDU42014.1 alpha-ketoglutarate-dependent taurine dioxygenase [Pyrenophora tritici-repentis Pt-1C-BFP]KAF7442429.1 alpha-ketoglutarate-dependent taurine dioxygenase protein [Pyrenophora tritici-repentis]KAF7579194.1 TauD, Probable taurine catabolism dioxygenase [Pyrenophora tritici-repentis]KAG9378127.1 
MAPGLVDVQLQATTTSKPVPNLKSGNIHNYTPGQSEVQKYDETYEYEDLRPWFPDITWPAYTEIPYTDKGQLGDPNFKNLLASATDVFDYNPKIGTEVHGVDLANLTDVQKNDLARLIATRGVVFFRDQKNFGIDEQRELGKYFGELHKHATTGVPKRPGLEDVHVIFTGENSPDLRALFTPTFLWHSDVSYELQPPSYTSLKVLTGPPRGGGGDTLWSSQYAAYDMLSPHMQKYLESLTALHSADLQAQGTRDLGRTVRREPVTTAHPLIRTNPVTGWKSLYFNPGFVTKIIGVPKTESDHIISFLNEIVATSPEVHARFQWREGDVAFWDNRVTNHSATYGFAPHRRHAVRVAVRAERPYLEKGSRSQEEEVSERFGVPRANKDGSGVVNYND